MYLEALTEVEGEDRAAVLRTVQEQLVTGLHLQHDDVPALARLVVLGERRSPGALLRHCRPDVLRRLADAALASEAPFGLLTGRAAWDGQDPAPPAEEAWEARKHRTWGEPAQITNVQRAYGGGYGPGTAAEAAAREVVTAAVEPLGAPSTRDAGVRLDRDEATTTASLPPA